jgi:O-antigen/teichoic acid export membrane protein
VLLQVRRRLRVEHTRALSVRQNFSWTLAGNLFSAACNWLVLSAIAKLGSAELLGQYALGLAIAGPAITLAHMQLRSLVTSDAKRDYLFGEYLALGLLTLALAVVAIALIAFGGREQLNAALVITVVGFSEALFSFSEITYGLFQRLERLDRITISLVMRGVLALLSVTGALLLTHDILWAVIGLATTHAIVLLGYDLPTSGGLLRLSGSDDSTRLQWDPRRLLTLFWLAIPIGVTLVLNMINYNVARYFIAAYLGDRDLGIFAASASFIGAGQRILSAFSYSVSSRLARSFSNGQLQQFTSLILKLGVMGLILGVGFLVAGNVAGKWILTIVFSKEFAEHDAVLLWLLAAGAVGYISVWGPALTSARFFRVQVPISLLGIASSGLLNWTLIPSQGLVGAARATFFVAVISCCAGTAVLLWVLRRERLRLALLGTSND